MLPLLLLVYRGKGGGGGGGSLRSYTLWPFSFFFVRVLSFIWGAFVNARSCLLRMYRASLVRFGNATMEGKKTNLFSFERVCCSIVVLQVCSYALARNAEKRDPKIADDCFPLECCIQTVLL